MISRMVNLPNVISLSRLLSVPLIVLFILSRHFNLAFMCFLFAALSDALDGFLARVFSSRTTFGAYLDPIADKVLLISVYAALGKVGLIQLWIVILVVFRDVLIIGGSLLLFLFKNTQKIKPLFISKLNTAVQLFYALFVLSQINSFFGLSDLNLYLGYLVGLTTLLSGASYVKLGFIDFNKMDISVS